MGSVHRLLMACVCVVAVLLSFSQPVQGQEPLDQSVLSPAEMHRLEGEGKARALGVERMAALPALVLDQSGFDASYYDLYLRIDEVTETIDAYTRMYARARTDGFDSPSLNLTTGLTVDSVQSFGRPVSWTHTGGFLYVTLDSLYQTGEEFAVTVFYHGTPPTGGFQGFEFGVHDTVPMISTLSEPYLAQSWWPCKDTPSDKADSTDVRMRVNSAFYGVSNGTLRDSVDHGDGTTTYWWHESYPITTYLVSLAITNYSPFVRWYRYGAGDADSMPVRFYPYPERLTAAESYWPIVVDQIGFLAETFCEYPFINEKYGIAHFTWGGAMEHQTVSSHTSSSFGLGQYVVVHELSHQWFGDMITCRDWHHIWMNEGFASYCEALWAEHNGGAGAYRTYMAGMNYYSGGRIHIDDTTSVGNIFSTRVYDKGAWVLHMLRGIMGDSTFFLLMRTYVNDPAFRHRDVVTEEFRDLAENLSGIDLGQFFEDWIYGYYYPKWGYSWFAESDGQGGGNVYVHLRQTQSTSPLVFDMPVNLRFAAGAGTDTIRAWNTARDQDFHFATAFVPTSITFDLDDWVLDESSSEAYGVRILNDSLVVGGQYSPFHDSLIAKGSPASVYGYGISAGALPAGLSLDTLTGVISGIPLDSGSVDVTFQAWGEVGTARPYGYKTLTVRTVGAPYMPGDQNGDRLLGVQDVVLVIDYVFREGTAPVPPEAVDPSGDCITDIRDVVVLVEHVFRAGPFPRFGCID